jgi:hypothetical protein
MKFTYAMAGALALASAMSAGAQENYATWAHNRDIVLNTSTTGANVAGTVTGFPVLVRLVEAESTVFAQARPGGADLRFAKSNGSPLPYQIERWDSTARRAEIWVRVDTILGNNSTQSIRMYWGSAGAADSSKGAAVFDTASGFQAVYHMADPNDSLARDATRNGYNATPGNTGGVNPASVPAAIGVGKSLNNKLGSNETGAYYTIPNTNTAAPKLNFNSDGDVYTLSAWVKAHSLPDFSGTAPRMGVIMKYGTASNHQYGMLGVGNNSDPTTRWSGNHKSTTGEAWNEAAATTGVWQHVVVVRSGGGVGASQTTGVIYVNGEPSAIAPTGNGTSTNNGTGGDLVFGAYSNLQRFLDGEIDEIRLSNTARSADWIKLNYENQKRAHTLTNIGLFVPQVPGAPTGVTAQQGNAQATVSWLAPVDDGGAAVSSYKAWAVSDTSKNCTANTGLSCAVTGLTNGQAYTFVVAAINSAGMGAPSAPSTAVTPTSIARGGLVFRVTGKGGYSFDLPASLAQQTDRVTLTIVDAWGRAVWSRSVEPARTGIREVVWDGKAAYGMQVSAGMYVARLSVTRNGKVSHLQEQSVTLNP